MEMEVAVKEALCVATHVSVVEVAVKEALCVVSHMSVGEVIEWTV